MRSFYEPGNIWSRVGGYCDTEAAEQGLDLRYHNFTQQPDDNQNGHGTEVESSETWQVPPDWPKDRLGNLVHHRVDADDDRMWSGATQWDDEGKDNPGENRNCKKG